MINSNSYCNPRPPTIYKNIAGTILTWSTLPNTDSTPDSYTIEDRENDSRIQFFWFETFDFWAALMVYREIRKTELIINSVFAAFRVHACTYYSLAKVGDYRKIDITKTVQAIQKRNMANEVKQITEQLQPQCAMLGSGFWSLSKSHITHCSLFAFHFLHFTFRITHARLLV